MNSLLNDADDSARNNTWKYLTAALGAICAIGVGAYIAWLYIAPPLAPVAFHAAPASSAIDNAIGAGFLGIVAIVAIPVLAILIPAIIVGFGFGIGFGATDIGRAIRSRRMT